MDTDTSQTQRKPLTEAQQRRLAKLQAFAGTPQQRRAIRFIRPILVLLIGGIGLCLASVLSWNSTSEFQQDSLAYRIGQHGVSTMGFLLGLAMLTGGVLLLRKIVRERRAAEAQARQI